MHSTEPKWKAWFSKESLFQLGLWILYFIVLMQQKEFYNERTGEAEHLGVKDFAFAFNYLIVVVLISYWILPKYLYRKKYWQSAVFGLLILLAGVLVEEYVMERIFYGDSQRGQNFPGFFPTLWDIGPTILFFVGAKLAWDNLRKQTDLEQMQKEKMESQLQFLKSQLNPHFLFNNLNNLYSYAQEQSPKTGDIILQLSAIMRYMLYESRENLVPLGKELQYLRDFIRLQELQMEDRGTVDFEVVGRPVGHLIAPLMLITFVENCFKHSMSGQADNIEIDVRAIIEGDQLHFHCRNTYSAAEQTTNNYLTRGIGLENVRKRLELQYPNRHELLIRQEDDFFIVDLHLDLRVQPELAEGASAPVVRHPVSQPTAEPV
jgi:hypothetical protein